MSDRPAAIPILLFMNTDVTSTLVPSHKLATWLMVHITAVLDRLGLAHEKTIEEVIYVIIVSLIAIFIGWAVRSVILWCTRRIVDAYHTEVGSQLLRRKVLSRCSHVIPPVVILCLIPLAFDRNSSLLHLLKLLLLVYCIIVVTNAICVVLTFAWQRFDKRNNTRNLPLQGIINIICGILWIIAAIVSVSVLVDKSPAVLLTGLGAFAAALMLIFKDSILGFVAGIQLSQNDMLHVGDWIVVPSTIADGIVTEVTLSAVKVRNWDNTIVTLPPYTLVSTSFQNWRGMSDSGWRLISRSFYFDNDSIIAATPDLIDSVSSLPGMKQFIERIRSHGPLYDPGVAVVNGTIDTNLGLFRAYMCSYLLAHPLVAKDQQILVRIMKPSPEGMPLQIYCYTTTQWIAYEAVQSEIFEHIALMCPLFRLRAASADYREVNLTSPRTDNH